MEFHTCCNKCRLLGHFSCRKSHTFLDTCLITSAPGRFTVVAAHLNSVSFLTVLQESACGGLAECLRRMLSTEVLPHPIRVHSDFPTFQSGCLERPLQCASLFSSAPQVPLTSHRPQGGDIAYFGNHCVKGNVAKLQIAKMKIYGVQHLVCTKHPSVNSTRRIHHGAYHLQL
ncbi:hypothetical protein T09_9239 [Trichinella sp. T9]|nr:hypothetical protein T09_9239 [Trichinella sp. T9]